MNVQAKPTRDLTRNAPLSTEPGPTPGSRPAPDRPGGSAVVLSFDVEEHDRIEAAAGLTVGSDMRVSYSTRMVQSTERILAALESAGATATFYLVGEIGRTHPELVRRIANAGHELGSHGWDHRRVHAFTAETFYDDVRRSKDVLEDVSGTPVVGYRAPTFSVTRQTWWAIDVLARCGMTYDTSVFPVRHDRYGIPDAPRTPFVAEGPFGHLIELPPATYRVGGQNLPVAGGGYFRLFPLAVMRAGIAQLGRIGSPLAMLYFHPWEFDPGQPKLPLGRLSRWRTYVGIDGSEAKLDRLLKRYAGRFCRAIDVVEALTADADNLPRFRPAD